MARYKILSRALRMTLWVTYDHVGKLMMASIVWSLAIVAGVSLAASLAMGSFQGFGVVLGVIVGVLTAGGIAPVLSAGICHMAKILIETRDGSLRDMLEGVRIYGARAFGIGMAYAGIFACLGASAWFYASRLKESLPVLGYALSAVALWALIFAILTAFFAIPALVQKKGGIYQTLKLATLLALDNPGLGIGLAVQLGALTALAFLLPPFFFILYGGLAVVLLTSAYEMLARKYTIIEAEKEAAHGIADKGRIARAFEQAIEKEDQYDDYLNRGFRDFVFPWKG